MGACSFETHVKVNKTTSDQDAFTSAREQAQFDSGHGGYTGTLAEKSSFTMIARVKSRENADRIISALYNTTGPGVHTYREEAAQVIDDKWGPAGAIRYPIDRTTDGIVFFGFASC